MKNRKFVPIDFKITTWDALQPYYNELKSRNITNEQELNNWLEDMSEIDTIVEEHCSWVNINTSVDTTNKSYEETLNYYYSEIEPKMTEIGFELNKKLSDCQLTVTLNPDEFKPYLRSVDMEIKLYREENIPLETEMKMLEQQYSQITGAMTVKIGNKDYTLEQANAMLLDCDSELRKIIYKRVWERRLQDKDKLNDLFTKLITIRDKIAKNAGFDNYRDYMFANLGRFDYTPQDCFNYHSAVKEHIMPLYERLMQRKANNIGCIRLFPWDTEAEPLGVQPLNPFTDASDLTEKSIKVFDKIDPYFGDCLRKMRDSGRIDLDSRNGKAPGGFNSSLSDSGIPFTFMNAASTQNDVVIMMHEGGHAVHAFLSNDLRLNAFKAYPSEMAELASMSMELFSMDHWGEFYDNEADVRRAKFQEIEHIVCYLPWFAIIDKFQHWIYTNVGHTVNERETAWISIFDEFTTGVVNWEGLEYIKSTIWQKQIHLFEYPFYYIEYGISQLGALAMWRQYNIDKQGAIDNYKKALSLGYTKGLKELYATAGIKFDLSPSYIKEIKYFVQPILNEMIESENK